MRQVVEARDVQVILGKSKEFSYKLLQKIRRERINLHVIR